MKSNESILLLAKVNMATFKTVDDGADDLVFVNAAARFEAAVADVPEGTDVYWAILAVKPEGGQQ